MNCQFFMISSDGGGDDEGMVLGHITSQPETVVSS